MRSQLGERGMMGRGRQVAAKSFGVLSLSILACALSGCGLSQMTSSMGDGGLFSSGKKESSWTPIITEESMLTAARTNSDGPVDLNAANGCPPLQVEGGQRYVTYYEGNRIGDGAAVIHRGEITKTARECQYVEGQVTVKYGIAGRVLLGPKGKPGSIALPVTMQIVDKTKNKVKSEPFIVNVEITRQNPISYFSVVRDVTIPVKEGATPQDYSVVLAFDKSKHGAN